AAGERGLAVPGDGVDVRRVGGERHLHAAAVSLLLQLAEQVAGPAGPLRLQNAGEGVEPFAGFGRVIVAVGAVALNAVRSHVHTPRRCETHWNSIKWVRSEPRTERSAVSGS